MSPDQRGAERLPILGRLTAEVTVFQPMTVRDISVTGLSIETSFPMHLDSLHDLRLSLGERVLVVKGRVVHSRIVDVGHDVVTYSVGVDFIEPSERVTSAIADYLTTVKTERAGG